MESIGEKLRLAREQHTYSLEQVARDTNVSRRFLQALEDEDRSLVYAARLAIEVPAKAGR